MISIEECLIVFILQVISIAWSVYNWKVNKVYGGENWLVGLYICLIGPFLEEAVFRSVMKNYMIDLYYGVHINAVVFGLFHASNYIYNRNVKQVLFQVITTTYIGSIMYMFDAFHWAFCFHSLYNTVIYVFSRVIFEFFFREKLNVLPTYSLYECVKLNEKSVDDYIVGYDGRFNWHPERKFIGFDKLRPDIAESIKKYNEMVRLINENNKKNKIN